MKKVLIGCGIVFLITVLMVGACTGFVIYKGVQLANSFEAAGRDIAQLNQNYPFTEPPEGTEFDSERFDDYLHLRGEVISRTLDIPVLGAVLESVREAERDNGQVGEPQVGMTDAFRMIGDIPRALQEIAAKFDTRQMSIDEFAWYSQGVYQAISTGSAAGDAEMAELWNVLRSRADELAQAVDPNQQQGQQMDVDIDFDITNQLDAAEARTAPQANIDLVREHRKDLLGSPALAIAELIIVNIIRDMSHAMPVN